MKFYETSIEQYLQKKLSDNYHNYITYPEKTLQKRNYIIYGRSGIGKYSQMLHLLYTLTGSRLKKERTVRIQIDKNTYVTRCSEVHYELDCERMQSNSKNQYQEFLQQIQEKGITKDRYVVIINMEEISKDLEDLLIQLIHDGIGMIILTKSVGHINDKIMETSHIIRMKNVLSQNERIRSILERHDLKEEHILNQKEYFLLDKLQKNEIEEEIFDRIDREEAEIKMTFTNDKRIFKRVRELCYEMQIYGESSQDHIRFQPNHEEEKYNNNKYREIYHLERKFYSSLFG